MYIIISRKLKNIGYFITTTLIRCRRTLTFPPKKAAEYSISQRPYKRIEHARGGENPAHNSAQSYQKLPEWSSSLQDLHHEWTHVVLEEYPGHSVAALPVVDGSVPLSHRVLVGSQVVVECSKLRWYHLQSKNKQEKNISSNEVQWVELGSKVSPHGYLNCAIVNKALSSP